jgi:outer membrane lipoprotein-sorting protein
MKTKTAIAALFCGLFIGAACAQGQGAPLTADEIIKKANHMALYQGHDSKGKVKMTITDKQGRTRERAFNMLRKDVDDTDRDQKYFVYFKTPADVRKMVFMVQKHAALEVDDDRWLYMPSLDLVKRIAAGDKRTSFVGSDFLYEDISGRSPKEDRHELVETTAEAYIIKNTPLDPGSVEFEYYIAHIDKNTFMPLSMAFYKSGDRRYRVIENIEFTDIASREDGAQTTYRTVTRSVATDLENGSKTEMTFSDIAFNIGLEDGLFTERYLRRPPREAMR